MTQLTEFDVSLIVVALREYSTNHIDRQSGKDAAELRDRIGLDHPFEYRGRE